MMSGPPPGLVLGAFVPQTVNVTPGSSALAGLMVKMGQWFESMSVLTSAASFAVTGGIGYHLNAVVDASINWTSCHKTMFWDNSTTRAYPAYSIGAALTNTGSLCVNNSAGTYTSASTSSSTIPFTWATDSDKIHTATRALALC